MAEAEQSLAFLRNACSIGREKVDRCKQTIERLEKSFADLTQDREIALLLKMDQICVQAKGDPRTDWKDAVLTPQEELERANRAIAKAERRRSLAVRRLANIKEIVSFEEWRHACEKKKMEDLQEYARDLDLIKVGCFFFSFFILHMRLEENCFVVNIDRICINLFVDVTVRGKNKKKY